MFAVKTLVIRELLNSPEWVRKLEGAKSMREVEWVLREFVLEKGWKVEEVNI